VTTKSKPESVPLAPPTHASKILLDRTGQFFAPRRLRWLASHGRIRSVKLTDNGTVFNVEHLLEDISSLQQVGAA
jgi:hypothetical protein